MYGGLDKSPYGNYVEQASTYLDSYGQKHGAPGAKVPAKPSSGKKY